jgi:hypothetical protein
MGQLPTYRDNHSARAASLLALQGREGVSEGRVGVARSPGYPLWDPGAFDRTTARVAGVWGPTS